MVSGGVERVTLNLIRQFAADCDECVIALRRAHGELLDEARSLARVVELAPQGLHQFIPRLSRLIADLRPTHVISAFSDVAFMTWLAKRMANSTSYWVHGVHNTHAALVARKGVFGRVRHHIMNRMAGFVYRHADATVGVSDGVSKEVVGLFCADPGRVLTIHNPIIAEHQLQPMTGPRHALGQPYRVVALGRLERQKGFDVLIRAMNKVPQPWRLEVWGEGSERKALERLVADCHLESAVRLPGHTDQPFDVLRGADLFVLPSRHEGLPTVLVEALACQCQIVATDCLHGPREILEDGRWGQLVAVEDADGLASAITAAIDGQAWVEPGLLLARACDFTHERAYCKWRDLLQAGVTTAAKRS